MAKNIAAVCLFVAISVSPACAAVPDRVALDAKLCRPAPSALLQSLPPGLRDGGRYVHLCPVSGENRKIALYILTPRIDLMAKDLPFVNDLIKNNQGISRKSIILDANERIIGELPSSFPFDPPDMFTVTFTDWQKGFPFRIEFYILANSLHGPERPAPLYWNPRIGKFQNTPP
jgi:hypothetical protein